MITENELLNMEIAAHTSGEAETQQECPDCGGEGKFDISDCCGAEPRGNGDCDTSDFGICSECHEHCEYGVLCETCNGTGKIYKS